MQNLASQPSTKSDLSCLSAILPAAAISKHPSRGAVWSGRHSLSCSERPQRVCAVTRRRFPVGASPTRQRLQPEAIGTVMEVTKWLKPSISVSRIGDSASVQAVTRVNAEQALYGAFEVTHLFHTILHFVYSSFFVR